MTSLESTISRLNIAEVPNLDPGTFLHNVRAQNIESHLPVECCRGMNQR